MKWHRADENLAATEMGKAKRNPKRDAKLPCPPLALLHEQVLGGKNPPGWPRKV